MSRGYKAAASPEAGLSVQFEYDNRPGANTTEGVVYEESPADVRGYDRPVYAGVVGGADGYFYCANAP